MAISNFFSSASVALGYHTSQTAQNSSTMFNKLNFFGYFPVVGIVTAAIRIIAITAKETTETTKDLKEDSKEEVKDSTPFGFKVVFVARAVLEAIGGGLLFLIPDLIVWINRSFFSGSYSTETPQGPGRFGEVPVASQLNAPPDVPLE